MLGSYVCAQAVETGWETFATYSNHEVEIPGCRMARLEVRDPEQTVRVLGDIHPDVVIHTVAIVRPDICEVRTRDSFDVNVIGTYNALAAAEKIGAHFVQVSTDLVFSGERNPFQEDDPPSPVNYYGLTKACAEAAVRAAQIPSAIVRTSTIYGPRKFGHLESYSDRVVEGLRARQMVPAFVDQYRQCIPVWNVADVLLEIAERRLTGIYHAVSPDVTTRHQLAVRIAEELSLDIACINPISMSEVNAIARRPKLLVIDTANTSRALNTRLLTFEEGVRELKCRMVG